ncbi:MAG: S9 family peptidase [Bacteroidales bacterium]|nr:S9 family peptidase [Bacteroidales bacterium]
MKRTLFCLTLVMIMVSGCKQAKNEKTAAVIDKENRETPDFSKGVMDEKILWYLGRLGDVQVSPDGKTLLYAVTYYDYRVNKGNTELYTMPMTGGEPTRITVSEENEMQPIWRPDGKKIAYLCANDRGMQIWEADPDGKNAKAISNVDGDINGFGYSPDLKHICYFKNVQLEPTIEERYPDLPDADAMIYDDLMYRHWNYWADGSYSHLFVADYPSLDNEVDLLEGRKFHCPNPPFGGMEEVSWHPDGNKLVYCCKKLTGKAFAESTNTDIYLYDLNTKATVNLTETNKGYDMDPVISPDGKKMVWWNMKTDGFESEKHSLMLFDFQSGTAEDYSLDFDQDATGFAWSEDSKTVYFISCIEATHHVYKMDVETRIIEQITEGDYDYNTVQVDGNQLIVTRTTHAEPSEIYAVQLKDKSVKQLSFINKDILDKITPAKSVKRWVKTTDGKQMLVWVILPPNFDSTKKYPALLYCQGGPQSSVSQFFSYRWNFQMMAAHDYIIVAPNRRGLPGFGHEWNDEISGDYGGQNMKDYLAAIDDVAKEPYVDENRLGCVGASYGGFSVYWLAGHHQKRFKAFIAHCGMFNLESWYGTTEELFFANHDIEGPYWKTPVPKSYSFSPHKFVGNWDTPILVIHGGKDFRIPYTEGMQAFDAAQMQGIPSRFLYFPEECHFVSKPQNSMLWQREFFRWLDQWLKNS